MALTRVQKKNTKLASVGDSSPTGTLVSTPIQGNLLVAWFAANENLGDVTLSGPGGLGWTQIPTDSPINVTGACVEYGWYKIAGAAESKTVSGTWTAPRAWVVEIIEYNDSAGGTWTLDKTKNNSGSSTAPDSGTTLTTTQANEVWVAGLINKNVETPSTPTNSFTAVDEGNTAGGVSADIGFGFYEKIVSGTATANVSNTISSSRNWVGMIATFYSIPPAVILAGRALLGAGV